MQWTIHFCRRTQRQYRTSNQLHWHHGGQRFSNTCLPTTHGLHKSLQHGHSQQTMGHNCARTEWQTMRSSCMDTNGYTCTLSKDNQSSYHFMCIVQQPSVSASRLEKQGQTRKNNQRWHTHTKGFSTTLINKHSLYYLRTMVVPTPPNYTLQIQQTSEGTMAK